MRSINFKSFSGEVKTLPGAYALEHAELYPQFNTDLKDSSAIAPRSIASLQLRIKNALRTLKRSQTCRILLVCSSLDADALGQLKELCAAELDDEFLVVLASGKKEMFGLQGQPGLVSRYRYLLMPAILLIDHGKWLSLMDKAMAENPELKLILYGDAADCAQLGLIWPKLEEALRADLVQELPATGAVELTAALVEGLKQDLKLKSFDAEALKLLSCYLCRLSGDRRWLYLPEFKFKRLLEEAVHYSGPAPVVGARALLKALGAGDFRENYLAAAQLRDHRDKQLLIATQGLTVGQINGLSVVQMAGSEYEFGEPVRITATMRAGGEGDVIDIERKAELAGQIHAKAMMIINGYLTKEFGARAPLPVSASLVFEQSYSEVDGDSASLTGLCAVISCLSGVPVRQDLAVTGAVDQLGDVQPVGGVNEKIEGFFKVCRLHGLTGTQGVIIPQSCVQQLVLRPCVVNAVKEGRFHIYTVSSVAQAVKILTMCDWGSEEEEGSIVNRIITTLSQIGTGKEDIPWWKFWA